MSVCVLLDALHFLPPKTTMSVSGYINLLREMLQAPMDVLSYLPFVQDASQQIKEELFDNFENLCAWLTG